jgi:hypothetical protein
MAKVAYVTLEALMAKCGLCDTVDFNGESGLCDTGDFNGESGLCDT